jgi:carbamate kinase
MKIVVALGGNALTSGRGKNTYVSTINSLKRISIILADLVKKKHNLVITHGSGPQAGALLLQNELSKKKVSKLPLDVLDAEVQGQLGYLIEQTLLNTLNEHRLRKSVVTLLTQVVVDRKDPSFRRPSKPIGQFYTKTQLNKIKKKGATYKEDSGRGYRRFVASPYPLEIVESKTIKNLVKKGIIVIATGGGGIPVCKKDGQLFGIEAVIDKDLASSVLANQVKADVLLIVTSIDRAYLNFRKKNQKGLNKVKLKDAIVYLKQGHFAEGSMAPKIMSAIEFLKKGGKKVIITDPGNISKSIAGMAGTTIIK